MPEFCWRCQKITDSEEVHEAQGVSYHCKVCDAQVDFLPDDDRYFEDGEEQTCHYCGGEGWGIIGCDWDSDDPINGPYLGESERCPCCHGSGLAKDCTFW